MGKSQIKFMKEISDLRLNNFVYLLLARSNGRFKIGHPSIESMTSAGEKTLMMNRSSSASELNALRIALNTICNRCFQHID